jgi:hypothetical protein
MTNGIQTTVHFACPKCDAIYKTTQELRPERQSGTFSCFDCHAEVHAWSGSYNFTGWNAVEVKPMRRGWH